MPGWIADLVNSAVGGVRAVVDAVAARLASIWHVLIGFFALVQQRWRSLRTNVTSFVAQQIRHAAAVATTLKWLATVWVPRKIAAEVAKVRAWASSLIAQSVSLAKSLVNNLTRWAVEQFAKAIAAITSLRDWAIRQVNGLIGDVARIGRLVFSLLSSPERLALWLVGAMWSALVHYTLDNLHRVAVIAYSRRRQLWEETMHLIESIIADIL